MEVRASIRLQRMARLYWLGISKHTFQEEVTAITTSEVGASQARLVKAPQESSTSFRKGFWERSLVPHGTLCPYQQKRGCEESGTWSVLFTELPHFLCAPSPLQQCRTPCPVYKLPAESLSGIGFVYHICLEKRNLPLGISGGLKELGLVVPEEPLFLRKNKNVSQDTPLLVKTSSPRSEPPPVNHSPSPG